MQNTTWYESNHPDLGTLYRIPLRDFTAQNHYTEVTNVLDEKGIRYIKDERPSSVFDDSGRYKEKGTLAIHPDDHEKFLKWRAEIGRMPEPDGVTVKRQPAPVVEGKITPDATTIQQDNGNEAGTINKNTQPQAPDTPDQPSPKIPPLVPPLVENVVKIQEAPKIEPAPEIDPKKQNTESKSPANEPDAPGVNRVFPGTENGLKTTRGETTNDATLNAHEKALQNSNGDGVNIGPTTFAPSLGQTEPSRDTDMVQVQPDKPIIDDTRPTWLQRKEPRVNVTPEPAETTPRQNSANTTRTGRTNTTPLNAHEKALQKGNGDGVNIGPTTFAPSLGQTEPSRDTDMVQVQPDKPIIDDTRPTWLQRKNPDVKNVTPEPQSPVEAPGINNTQQQLESTQNATADSQHQVTQDPKDVNPAPVAEGTAKAPTETVTPTNNETTEVIIIPREDSPQKPPARELQHGEMELLRRDESPSWEPSNNQLSTSLDKSKVNGFDGHAGRFMSTAGVGAQIQQINRKLAAGETVSTAEYVATAANLVDAAATTAGQGLDDLAQAAAAAKGFTRMAKIAGPAVQGIIAIPSIVSAAQTGDTQQVGQAVGSAVGGISAALVTGTIVQTALPMFPGVGFAAGFVVGVIAGDGMAVVGGHATTLLFSNDPAKRQEASKELVRIAYEYTPVTPHGVINLVGAGTSSVGRAVEGIGSGVSYLGDAGGQAMRWGANKIGEGATSIKNSIDTVAPAWLAGPLKTGVDLVAGANSTTLKVMATVSDYTIKPALNVVGKAVEYGLGKPINFVGQGLEYVGHTVSNSISSATSWISGGVSSMFGWGAKAPEVPKAPPVVNTPPVQHTQPSAPTAGAGEVIAHQQQKNNERQGNGTPFEQAKIDAFLTKFNANGGGLINEKAILELVDINGDGKRSKGEEQLLKNFYGTDNFDKALALLGQELTHNGAQFKNHKTATPTSQVLANTKPAQGHEALRG